jgi:hypothetical protein
MNTIIYYYAEDSSTSDDKNMTFAILRIVILYSMIGIQFRFVYEMGEVYIKITSDDPQDSFKNQKALKYRFILLYSLEAALFILNFLMIIREYKYPYDFEDLYWALIVCFILVVALIAVLVCYHFFKYYHFFAKMKL